MKQTTLCYNNSEYERSEGMYQISLLFMKFIIFSVIGYVAEMITCAIIDKRVANRGFLCGPIIPIYGVGSLALVWFLKPFYDNVFLIILLGMFLTTSIEYVTSYILEKIFHNKWWDYTQEKFNIHGRVCLKNSVLFAIGTPIIIYFINPYVTDFLLQMKDEYLILCAILIFIVFFLDCIYSGVVAYNLRHRIIIVEDLKNEKLAKIPGMLEKMLKKRMKGIKKYPKRLLKAFPNIFNSNKKEFEIMKKIALIEKSNKQKKKKKNKK